MPDAADFVEWVSGDNVLDWRRAVDAAFDLPPNEREAALRVIRPVYESRLTPQFHAVPWGASLHERDAFRTSYKSAHGLTQGFTKTSEADLLAALEADPRTLVVFRLILGYTTAELSAALALIEVTASKMVIDTLEKGHGPMTAARRAVLAGVAKAVTG